MIITKSFYFLCPTNTAVPDKVL